jgi:hypothetical protein
VPKDQGHIFDLRSVCHLIIVVERPHKKGGDYGPMSPRETLPGPQKNQVSPPPPLKQPAPAKQPATEAKKVTKSFADAAASKKPAAPTTAIGKVITDLSLSRCRAPPMRFSRRCSPSFQIFSLTDNASTREKGKSLQTAFFNVCDLRTTRNELEVFSGSQDLDVILVFLRAGV